MGPQLSTLSPVKQASFAFFTCDKDADRDVVNPMYMLI